MIYSCAFSFLSSRFSTSSSYISACLSACLSVFVCVSVCRSLSLSLSFSQSLSLSIYLCLSYFRYIFFFFLPLSISGYNSLFLSHPVELFLSVFFCSFSSGHPFSLSPPVHLSSLQLELSLIFLQTFQSFVALDK